LVSDEHKALYAGYGEILSQLSQRREAYFTRGLRRWGIDFSELKARGPEAFTEQELKLLNDLEVSFQKQRQIRALVRNKVRAETDLLTIIETRMKDLNRLSTIQLEEAKKLDDLIISYVRAKDSATPEQLEEMRKHMFATAKL